MSEIEIIDFVNQPGHPHIMIVVGDNVYRRFLTDNDLDLCRHLANELMTFVISRTGRVEGL